jgi:hypothetical protein
VHPALRPHPAQRAPRADASDIALGTTYKNVLAAYSHGSPPPLPEGAERELVVGGLQWSRIQESFLQGGSVAESEDHAREPPVVDLRRLCRVAATHTRPIISLRSAAMTMKETMKKLNDELDTMRARVDELRVKGNLGKMELRDKLAEYRDAIEPAYQKAKSTLADLSREAAEETKTMAKSLVAGWDELRKTHQQLCEESDRERERGQKEKRNSI